MRSRKPVALPPILCFHSQDIDHAWDMAETAKSALLPVDQNALNPRHIRRQHTDKHHGREYEFDIPVFSVLPIAEEARLEFSSMESQNDWDHNIPADGPSTTLGRLLSNQKEFVFKNSTPETPENLLSL